MEDHGIGRVRDHDGLGQLDAEPPVRVQAEPGLEHRRVRELRVHGGDPTVGAVVEPAVDPDRPVHAVHHPDVVAHEAPQSCEVEVEGIEQAARRSSGDAVLLDDHAASLELAGERAHELVAAA